MFLRPSMAVHQSPQFLFSSVGDLFSYTLQEYRICFNSICLEVPSLNSALGMDGVRTFSGACQDVEQQCETEKNEDMAG